VNDPCLLFESAVAEHLFGSIGSLGSVTAAGLACSYSKMSLDSEDDSGSFVFSLFPGMKNGIRRSQVNANIEVF
jgi:hypothetical protein